MAPGFLKSCSTSRKGIREGAAEGKRAREKSRGNTPGIAAKRNRTLDSCKRNRCLQRAGQ